MNDLEVAAHAAKAAGNILEQLRAAEQRLRAAEVENAGLLYQLAEVLERERCLQQTNTAFRDRLISECAEVDRLRFACSTMNQEVSQTLGRALGYPRFADDPANFPDSTDSDGVCVGEHVAETIAMEAAKNIKDLTAEVDRLQLTCSTLLDGCGVDDVSGRLMGEAGKRMKALMAENDRLRGLLQSGGATTGQPTVVQISESVWRVDISEVHGTIFNGPDAEQHARAFAAGIRGGQSRS